MPGDCCRGYIMAEMAEWNDWWNHYSKEYLLPLSILQLDPADRLVLRIAGKLFVIINDDDDS